MYGKQPTEAMHISIPRTHHCASVLLVAGIFSFAQPAIAQQTASCERVTKRGAVFELPRVPDASALHIQYRGASGTWRNVRDIDPSKTDLYVGDLTPGEAAEVRVRARSQEGSYTEWGSPAMCDPEASHTEADSWVEFLSAINTDPFEVYGWEGSVSELQRVVPRSQITMRGEHYVIAEHAGLLQLMPNIMFTAARSGFVPRLGIDNYGDPGVLNPAQEREMRALIDLIRTWATIPRDRPDGAVLPGWVMDGFDAGDEISDGDKMCTYLDCVPAVCGAPPLPPDKEFQDCGDLRAELDDAIELMDYWAGQGQFWLDTRNYLDLAIKGQATAESGLAVANMASALGLIVAPEPVSTVAGVFLAAQTIGSFAIGQLMDAIGVCVDAAGCSMAASLAVAENRLSEALTEHRKARAAARSLQEQLQICLVAAAQNNAALRQALSEYDAARKVHDECVANQVCEWKERPCR